MDLTRPFVRKIQEKVKEYYGKGYQIIIMVMPGTLVKVLMDGAITAPLYWIKPRQRELNPQNSES